MRLNDSRVPEGIYHWITHDLVSDWTKAVVQTMVR